MSFVNWKKNTRNTSNRKVNEYFSFKEFECKCTLNECEDQVISEELIEKLTELRKLCGSAIIITSAYRCEAHNKNIGGHPNSSHIKGMAADVICPGIGMKKLNENIDKVFANVGNALNFTHVDVRSGGPRRWKY